MAFRVASVRYSLIDRKESAGSAARRMILTVEKLT
jgi:hypothetical protein